MTGEMYRSCIEACVACARECEQCGDACIDDPAMAGCVRTCRDCADHCWTCASSMSRNSPLLADLCRACAKACDLYAAECGKYRAEHCRRCATACEGCGEECRKIGRYASVPA
jgi:hypothetical protein